MINQKDIMDALYFRHACKHYDPNRKVSDEDFATIMSSARLAPSSFGYEPWKFLIVESQDLKAKLYDAAWGARNSFAGADRFVIILARKTPELKYDSSYITHMMRDIHHLPEDVLKVRQANFANFEKNDFHLLDNERAMFDWASKQTYIALANMLYTAALLKIDSCPIEDFDRDKVEAIMEKEGLLNRKHFGVSVMASFGYRASEPHSKTRLPESDIFEII